MKKIRNIIISLSVSLAFLIIIGGNFNNHNFLPVNPQLVTAASEHGVVRVTAPSATLYDKVDGTAIRKLSVNSAWEYWSTAEVESGRWYCLGGNQWVKDTEVSVGVSKVWNENGKVVVNNEISAELKYSINGRKSGEVLNSNKSYEYNMRATDDQGHTWYRIGNQWISDTDVHEYVPVVSEHGVVRVTAPSATLYDKVDGTAIRKLSVNSAWEYWSTAEVESGRWYCLGGNQWVKDTEVSVKVSKVWNENGVVIINSGQRAELRYSINGRGTGHYLESNTGWEYNMKAIDDWGYTWYRTGNQWINGIYAHENFSKGEQIANKAKQYVGVPYVWGGTSPSGFDCSGLVQYVYNQCGISIPRTSQQQSTQGYEVSMSNLQPGDLLFWGSYGNAYHVAIYLGNNQYIHAPQPGQNVTIQSLNAWYPSFARRLI